MKKDSKIRKRKVGTSFKPDVDVAEKIHSILGSTPEHGAATKLINVCLRFALIQNWSAVSPSLRAVGIPVKER